MAGLEGARLDHYHLLEQVGQGGMATVYRARDLRARRTVAVKVLSPTISGEKRFIRRFRREASLVSRLKHPHIVPVIDYGEAHGLAYLVMPFIYGDTLQARMNQGRITRQEAVRWIDQIAAALQFAHDQGVIHRDIKPSNILIDLAGDARLTDFGLARMVEGTSSLTGSALMGTPAYMSPEQARGQRLDARSDQYSFGVILYQLSTGRLPFEADSPMATALMHIQEPVPRPTRFNPDLPLPLERVILRALAKDPEERFPSVAALNQAFQAALQGDALESLRPTQTAMRRPAPEAPAWRRALRGLLGGLRSGWALGLGALALALVGALYLPTLVARPAAAPAPTAPPPTRVPATLALPTATLPPTPPPPVASVECPGLSLLGFRVQGNEVAWLLDNGLGEAVRLVNLVDFEAPAGNRALEEIRLGGETVFEGSAAQGEFAWLEGADRSVPAGQTEELRLRFAWEAAPTGYRFTLVFDNGCTLTGSW